MRIDIFRIFAAQETRNDMARKRTSKAKEPIRLRFKKLANGNQSIYLDIYRNGVRSYEFLKLYIIPENTPFAKMQNEQTMQAANAIKAQRIIDLTNGEAGIRPTSKTRILFTDWIEQYAEKAKLSHKGNGYVSMLRSVRFQLLAYMGNTAKTKLLQAIDEEFCIGFITFLNNATTSNGKPLSGTTIYHYSRWLKDILQRAVADELITHNPIDKLIQNKEMPTRPEVQMDYLTIDEVKTLMQTPLKQTQIKQAFLFACFTGLRISDVRNLQWSNIKTDGETMRFEIIMKKTDTPLAGKIPNIAKEWMPEPTDSPFVFANLPTASNIDTVIRRWVAQSGIKKHVTFHTARHSFATMGLTLGTDLYTVSKLLGHKSIATTQVYAQIIDKKKDEASDLLDNAF